MIYCKLDEMFLQQMLSENSTQSSLFENYNFQLRNNVTYEAVNILAKCLYENSTLYESTNI